MEIDYENPKTLESPHGESLFKGNLDLKIRKRVFIIMVCINALLNYDTGVIPASLTQLESEMSLTYQQQAAIGSLIYIGVCTASFVVSMVFQRYSASKVITFMLIINSSFCFLFSFSYNITTMYIARLGMGFTQAFCVIYAPVWTNEFSPSDKCTRWMGILQCAVPLGVVLGYSVASLFQTFGVSFFNWRLAIRIQAILEIPLIYFLRSIDKKYIDIVNPSNLVSAGEKSPRGIEVRMDNISLTNLPGFCQQLKMLASNLIFVFLTLSLCCMFFVVTGIQYWITKYMEQGLNANPVLVIVGFVIISTTAPILGVCTGGYVADYYGGYKGRNIITAVKTCVGFGLLGFFFAVPSCFVKFVVVEIILLWFLLFFGGCIIPSATGIIVNSMPKELQSSSSSVSQLFFNFGGFFLSPILSAAVMDQFKDKIEALTWGFRFTLSWSLGSLVFILAAYLIILKDFSKYEMQNDISDPIEDADHILQLARRVKP
jgi:MFS transporter, Spinster family, sphingosine-1-phosphate transporter